MENIFISHSVGPSKLDLLLSEASELSEENKEKVILITDIGRLGKLMIKRQMKPREFYDLYDRPLHELQQYQHDLQIEWNTQQHNLSMYGQVPPNF